MKTLLTPQVVKKRHSSTMLSAAEVKTITKGVVFIGNTDKGVSLHLIIGRLKLVSAGESSSNEE